MKLFIFLLILLIGIINNFVNSNPVPEYITITPYGSYICDYPNPLGQGYYLPLKTCINLHYQDTYLELDDSKENLIITWGGEKCSNSGYQTAKYPLNTCTEISLPNTIMNFVSVISINTKPPANSINFNYYYQFNKTCSGGSYQRFYTNNFFDGYSLYECVNGKPSISSCDSYGNSCEVNNNYGGCQKDVYPVSVTC